MIQYERPIYMAFNKSHTDGRKYCIFFKTQIHLNGYVMLEVSVSSNIENRKEKFIILISVLYLIYHVLIWSPILLCFLLELLMSILMV